MVCLEYIEHSKHIIHTQSGLSSGGKGGEEGEKKKPHLAKHGHLWVKFLYPEGILCLMNMEKLIRTYKTILIHFLNPITSS